MSLPFSLYQIFAKKPTAGFFTRLRFAAAGLLVGVFLLLGMARGHASTPFTGMPFTEPGTQINASDFDNGTDAYGVSHPVPAGQNTSYRNTPVPMNTASPPQGGSGYVVGISSVGGDYLYPGDYVVYTTTFAGAGLYDITFDVATYSTGRYLHLEVDGNNVTGSVALPSTPDWNTYATVTAPAISVSNGTHVLKLVVDNPVGLININWMQFTPHVAKTYYVSNNGSDGNSGLSASSPWQTCAKVNSVIFGPGDSVLFQRGGVWHEKLIASGSGNASAPVTYADYGSGNKPVFTGADPLNNAGFVAQGNNVYTYNTAENVNSVLENRVFLQSGNPSSTPNTWSYGNGVLTISTTAGDNPNTDGALFEICSRVDELYTNGFSDLVYTNLVAQETALINDGYCVRSMGSINVTYNNCEAYYGGKHNFGCINSTQVKYVNCIAEYEMPGQGGGGATLYVSYADTDPAGLSAASSEYDNCIADHMEDTASGGYYPAFTCHGGQLGQTTFNNFSTNYGKFSVLQDSGDTNEHVNFNGGAINSADFEVYGNANLVVDGATFTGNAALDLYCQNNTFQNLKMQNILHTNGGQTGYNSAIVIRNGATANTIRFSTVVMDPTAGTGDAVLTLVSAGSKTNWYGNIFLSNGMVVDPFYFTPTSSDVGYTDYNLYNANATFGYGNLTLAQWQTDTGADAHALTSNPLFVSQASGNYNLQATSPAINAAPIPSSWLASAPPIPKDFNGNPRLVNGVYDIGAFEYQANAKPTITSPSAAAGTTGAAFSYTITATGSPTSYSVTGSLPAGLVFTASTGVISGTPTATGSATVTLGAANANGTGTASLTITINPPAPVITSAATAGGTVGASFTYAVTATNGPTSYGETGTLPAGLAFTSATGVISGTPTATGSATITVTASNAGGTGSKSVTITISSGPPVITSAATAGGTVGASFTYAVTATNGPTSYGETGTLPAGLAFTSATGVISGTPTAAGSFPVTIKATNSAGTGSATLTITVSRPAPPSITSATTATGTVSQPFTYTITATGSPTSYGESGTLPAGVTFTASSGVISGTPTATGSFPVTISATNAGGTGSASLTITINPPGAGNGTGLLGEYFNDPADGSTQFTDLVLTRVDPTVNFTWATGQSPDPSVNSTFFSVKWVGQVQPLYTDSYQFHVTSDDGARLYINGTKVVESWGPHAPQDAFGVISLTGGQKYTIELDYYQLGYGAQAKLEWQGNSGQQARQVIPASQLYPAAPPPVISSATTVSATVGTAFTYQIMAMNGPTSYGETGALPAGLSFNAGTGTISGTPTAAGASTVVIGATNANGTGSKHLTITVANPPAPVITSAGTAAGTVGTPFSYQITASNNPASFGATGLPAGLSASASGLISGTPMAAGTSSVTISATNAGGTGSKTLTLTVGNPPAPVVTGASLSGAVNQSLSYQVQATNNPTSYGATGLPGGLTISATGLISGTPTTAGTFNAVAKATNAGGSGTATIVFTISANHLSGSLATPPSSVNLTTEGTTDWAHWGSDGSGSWDRKVVNGNTVNAITGWYSRPTVFTYNGNAVSYLWTDGQNWNGQAQTTGFYFDGGPFQITAIADTTVRTMKVYLGSFGGHGQLTAHLSDGSSPDYVDSSLAVNANGVYTITYSAASAGQTLTVSWTATDGGRLNIQSASLH